jgi:hypothetical protein
MKAYGYMIAGAVLVGVSAEVEGVGVGYTVLFAIWYGMAIGLYIGRQDVAARWVR